MGLKILHNISYGLYILSSKDGNNINGCVLNSVMQTSSKPPTISVCVNRKNLTYEYIKKSGVFTISILPQDVSLKFIGRFGFNCGRDLDKFKGIDYKLGEKTGVPVLLEKSMGYIEAEVKDSLKVETHTIITADILNGVSFDKNQKPLTYAYYHQVKKGKSPKTAPTYQEDSNNETEVIDKYRCQICGYIYNPQEGDPDSGIEAGTKFEDLPHDWLSPICGASKKQFQKI
jgi:flavin reductase (DIM6/NTAB) family NADH-FMN oxidoreductase RutF/rubredoxin